MRLIDADKLVKTSIDTTDIPINKCLDVVLLEDIENAPTVGEWIPCSEKLPEDSGNYLITVADLRLGHNGEHTVTMGDFYPKAKKWNSVVDVYAWMPPPEPYRKEREEYELATEQMEHDAMYEPTYNSEDGSM